MIRNKFLVIGWDDEMKDYSYPEIIYSSIERKDDYYSKNGDKGLKDSKELVIRAYNHHYRDKDLKGIVVGKFDYDYKNGYTSNIIEIYNDFTQEEVNKWYKECWDAGISGQLGNIDTSWELSDLNNNDYFISINEYLPEDLCMCLYGEPGKSFTKECICKFDDGTMKYAFRKMINPNNDNEKIEWIEEWSKRQLKNAQTMYKGYGSSGPAYHWVMPKEFADRVVSWRWFKEGEKRYQYM